MRFVKAEQLLRLATLLQGTAEGLALQDIEQEFQISRRTAERMRDALIGLYPMIEEVRENSGLKRWKLPPSNLSGLSQVSADDLAELKAAIGLLRKNNLNSYADNLDKLWLKIKASVSQRSKSMVETDLEALLESDGHIMMPLPRSNSSDAIIGKLRKAIKSCKKVLILYSGRTKKEVSSRTVHPYGLLYGHRNYLVAWCEKSKELRTFSISGILEAKTAEAFFVKPKDFNIQQYAARSFGIYQEKPYDVVIKFSPAVAKELVEYIIHPSQKLEVQKDGSVIIKFTAGGSKEICRFVMKWEGEARILSPTHLCQVYQQMLNKLAQSS